MIPTLLRGACFAVRERYQLSNPLSSSRGFTPQYAEPSVAFELCFRNVLDLLLPQLRCEFVYRDAGCERLMSVPAIGPIISSAMVTQSEPGDLR
jgi:hypothetical protein